MNRYTFLLLSTESSVWKYLNEVVNHACTYAFSESTYRKYEGPSRL